MDIDPIGNRGREGFPVDQPLEALKKDHDFIQQLFDRYLQSQDTNVKKEAGPQILLLLDMHTALEEACFYPKVHGLDASLVDECEEEHQQAKQLIQQLKDVDINSPQCEQMFRQLADAIRHHIDLEENQLFPKVRQSNLDLKAMGLDMQDFEANMVAVQAERTERKDVTANQSQNRSAPQR